MLVPVKDEHETRVVVYVPIHVAMGLREVQWKKDSAKAGIEAGSRGRMVLQSPRQTALAMVMWCLIALPLSKGQDN
jgi:hypothetical protein